MSKIDGQAGAPAAEQSGDLEVRVARELLERTKAEGLGRGWHATVLDWPLPFARAIRRSRPARGG